MHLILLRTLLLLLLQGIGCSYELRGSTKVVLREIHGEAHSGQMQVGEGHSGVGGGSLRCGCWFRGGGYSGVCVGGGRSGVEGGVGWGGGVTRVWGVVGGGGYSGGGGGMVTQVVGGPLRFVRGGGGALRVDAGGRGRVTQLHHFDMARSSVCAPCALSAGS